MVKNTKNDLEEFDGIIKKYSKDTGLHLYNSKELKKISYIEVQENAKQILIDFADRFSCAPETEEGKNYFLSFCQTQYVDNKNTDFNSRMQTHYAKAYNDIWELKSFVYNIIDEARSQAYDEVWEEHCRSVNTNKL